MSASTHSIVDLMQRARERERESGRRPLVIYHGNCADGFSAAWVFWKRFGENCDFHAGVYSDPPPDVTGREVFLVDFSYKRPVVEEMLKTAKCITIIDHHKTAIEDLEPLRDVRGFTLIADVERSGSMLAWRWVFGSTEPPRLLGHVEDRDLWRFKLEGTREIQAFVFSHEYTFEQWDKMMSADAVELLKYTAAGAAIERKHHKDIAELLKVCTREMVIAGQWVPVASLPYTMSSDAGNALCKPYASANLQGEIVTPPFGACYWDTPEHRVFSLRSVEGGADVSEVAKSYGGGGHKHASGFRVPRDHELARA